MTWSPLSLESLKALGYTASPLLVMRSGKTTIAMHAYALGQYRLQCWFDDEILSPEC